MYELIVDCTNKCISNCVNCGTDSVACGEVYLELEKLQEILRLAKKLSLQIYLGGGCFFCHPEWRAVLEFNEKCKANILIDVPLDRSVLDSIALYSPEKYNYQISVSLWGTEEVHDKLSGKKSFFLISDYTKALSLNMRISFVITEELMLYPEKIIGFINENEQVKNFYFHRLMPTGRCSKTVLPKREKIKSFQEQLLLGVNDSRKLLFHHTLTGSDCKAFRKRLHIDWKGNVYGCGWVSEEAVPIANINDEMSLLRLIKAAQNGEYDGMAICPLEGKNA